MRGALGLLAILHSGAAVGLPAPAGRQVLRAERSDVSAPLLPRTASSFDGIGAGFAGVSGRGFEVWGVPPDPQGDVGPAHYVQIVNASFVVFGKDGRALLGPVPTRTLFAGF